MPARLAAILQPTPPQTFSAPVRSAAQTKLDILLAESNPIIRSVIAKILQRRGHKVEQLASGEAAVAALVQHPYDLALLATELPGISGIEATKLVRFARTGRPHLPVIGLTSAAREVSTDARTDAGMDAYLAKSIMPDQLIALVESFALAGLGRSRDAEATDLRPSTSPSPAVPAKEKRPAIDQTALTDLEKLGGKQFVDDIVSQFLSDARLTLDALNEVVLQVDTHGFHDQAHALRSCAANVGARAIYEKCLAWRDLSEAELAARGKTYMNELEADFDEASRILGLYLARA